MKGRDALVAFGPAAHDRDGRSGERTTGSSGNRQSRRWSRQRRSLVARAGTVLLLFLVALSSAVVLADETKSPFQDYEMTDEEIVKAIEEENCPGIKPEATKYLKDINLNILGSGLAIWDQKADKWADGISIRVLTPYSWICEQASEAARRFMPMTLDDVTDDMRRNVLRVYASPGKISKDAKKHGLEDYGMTHVAIRSTMKKDYDVLEPISVEEAPDWEWVEEDVTRETYYPTLLVMFDLDDVAKISKLDEKGEIFVVLANNLGKERKLKIKTKHFKKLP